MEYLLNNIFIRIIVSIFIGIPISALALVTGLHGLVLGYAGIVNIELWLILIGIITITGFIGLAGAWLRLFESTTSMTEPYRHKTRIMLFLGLISSSALSVWSILLDGLSLISFLLMSLAMGGLLFILATPKSSNKSVKQTV